MKNNKILQGRGAKKQSVKNTCKNLVQWAKAFVKSSWISYKLSPINSEKKKQLREIYTKENKICPISKAFNVGGLFSLLKVIKSGS